MGTSLAFGCPECGRKIRLKERSAGRRTRCRNCGTLVEVPFFPRQVGRRRSRRRRWRGWAALGVVVAVALIVPVAAWQWWQASVRSDQAEAIDQALADLESAEQAGDLSSAFFEVEAALAIARRSGIDPPGGLEPLVARRDALARSDLAARLAALPSRPPAEALETARLLADRVATDPALEAMRDATNAAVAEAAGRWVDQLLSRAREAEQSGRPAEALALAEQLATGLNRPPTTPVTTHQDRVRSFVADLVARRGTRIEPIDLTPGPTSGPDANDLSEVLRLIRERLLRRGYLVVAPDSPLVELWSSAPFRFRARLVEQAGASYLQSPHQTTLIRADLALERSGQPLWNDYFEARTRVPLPGLSAMEASRLEISRQASPEVEHRLARDARADLIEKLQIKLNNVPSVNSSS